MCHINGLFILQFQVVYVFVSDTWNYPGGVKLRKLDVSTMLEEDMEVAIKVVVVGNGAVGKSSMIQRYCKGIFTKDYKKTIGVDFLERQIL